MSPKVPIVRRCRLIASPPVRGKRVALLLDPDPHVGDGELQVLAESERAWAEAAGSPVVDRRDGHTQVGGELADVEQGLQPPRVLCDAFGIHDGQVRRREPSVTASNLRLPERSDQKGLLRGQKDGFVMTGSNLTYGKVQETLEFPGLFWSG